jgi:DNA-binding MarR family transcriptional regulator
MRKAREGLALENAGGEALRDLADFRFRLRGFLSFSEECAEIAGVTAQQYQLLQVVGVATGDGASISLVAQRMLLRHNSAVELVDRAERLDLVRRVADEQDHRRAIVKLTPKGSAVLEKLMQQHLGYLRKSGPQIAESLALLTGGGA